MWVKTLGFGGHRMWMGWWLDRTPTDIRIRMNGRNTCGSTGGSIGLMLLDVGRNIDWWCAGSVGRTKLPTDRMVVADSDRMGTGVRDGSLGASSVRRITNDTESRT